MTDDKRREALEQFKAVPWGEGEYIIESSTRGIVSHTLSKRDASTVAKWANGYLIDAGAAHADSGEGPPQHDSPESERPVDSDAAGGAPSRKLEPKIIRVETDLASNADRKRLDAVIEHAKSIRETCIKGEPGEDFLAMVLDQIIACAEGE